MQSIIEAWSVWLSSILLKPKHERSDFIGVYDNIHVRQQHNWDCGVACLQMSLRWWFTDNLHELHLELNSKEFEGKESPLWTIDIFLSLIQNGADGAVMFTTCKGVHPSHYDNSWYSGHIEREESSVNRKFSLADEMGLDVREETISIMEVCECLESGLSTAIILVDNNRMQYSLSSIKEAYSGHYIFLIGFDSSTDEVLFLDPSSDSAVKYVSSGILDAARSQPGTDRDIILIRKPKTEIH